MVIFPGTVIMWGLPVIDIPLGWALCDGTSGTPDLRDQFIIGAGETLASGVTGGANTVSLIASELPVHSHAVGTMALSTISNHSHFYNTWNAGTIILQPGSPGSAANIPLSVSSSSTNSNGSHSHTISGNTATAGSGDAHNNLPPYRAVLFIMKL